MSKMKRDDWLGTIQQSDEKNLEQREAMREENYSIVYKAIRDLPEEFEEDKEKLIALIKAVDEIKTLPCYLTFDLPIKERENKRGSVHIHNELTMRVELGEEESSKWWSEFRWHLFCQILTQTQAIYQLSIEKVFYHVGNILGREDN